MTGMVGDRDGLVTCCICIASRILCLKEFSCRHNILVPSMGEPLFIVFSHIHLSRDVLGCKLIKLIIVGESHSQSCLTDVAVAFIRWPPRSTRYNWSKRL